MRTIAIGLAGLWAFAGPLAAQRVREQPRTVRAPSAPAARPAPRDAAGSIVGGTVGGIAGALVGGIIVNGISGQCGYSGCNGSALGFGLSRGWMVGVPLGAYIGDHERGSFWMDLVVSAVAQEAGVLLARNWRGDVVGTVAPVLFQIAAVSATELASGAGPAARDTLTSCQR